MIEVKIPNKDTGLGPVKGVPGLARIFKGFINNFQELSLLWIHYHGFGRSYSKECMVKQLWIFSQQIGSSGGSTTRSLAIGMVKSVCIDAVVLAEVLISGCFTREQVPELYWI